MITLEKEFETNANQSGTQTFRQIKVGTRLHVNKKTKEQSTQNVYIYQRIDKEGKTYGYEVIIAGMLKAGTKQKFPGGIVKEINDDTETYPGASQFGRTGWFCSSEGHAEEVFTRVLKEAEETSEDEGIQIPNHEFAVKDYANEIGVPYQKVANWAKDLIQDGKLKVVRTERRAKIGAATKILAAV